MSLRLLMIETRRNVGLWLVPIILLVSWWLLSAWGWIVILWSSTNEQLQAAVVPFAAPAMAGAAAWMAGRERRRGTVDLLVSTPTSPLARGITLWLATALWGILTYAILAAYMMGRTALSATWGGPDIWRVVIALTAILAASAWGFFFGSLVPSRFTAPVVAIAALGIQQYVSGYMVPYSGGGYSQTWISFLGGDQTAYDLAPWQILTYLGFTGTALAALALKDRQSITSWSVLTAATALAFAGVVLMWGAWPRFDPESGNMYNGWGQRVEPGAAHAEPELVCEGTPVTVCVYAQYQPLLDDAIATANRLAEPLLGLPGVPLRTEEGDVSFRGGMSDSLLDVGDWGRLEVADYASTLVAEPAHSQHGSDLDEAQLVVRSWLLQRADIESEWDCDEPGSQHVDIPGIPTERVCEATSRFANLPAAEQRAWLEGHYADLRAGRLTLEDLP